MKKFSLDKEVLPVEEPSNHNDVLPINESFSRILDCLAGCFITCEGGRIPVKFAFDLVCFWTNSLISVFFHALTHDYSRS